MDKNVIGNPINTNILTSGPRTLTEYNIELEEMRVTSSNNISRAIVKFVFRRNMEYHVTNSLLQMFIMTSVGFLTFWFRVDNFTDRIMVSLTVMLVIATMMSTIQEVHGCHEMFKIECLIFSIFSLVWYTVQYVQHLPLLISD